MQAGDVEAKFEVGRRPIEGVGTEVNIELGKRYVNEAADNGERRAVKYRKNMEEAIWPVFYEVINQIADVYIDDERGLQWKKRKHISKF